MKTIAIILAGILFVVWFVIDEKPYWGKDEEKKKDE